MSAGFKMVDTCAAEFAAQTPYFYSTCDKENEAEQFINAHKTSKKKILVFGSGPSASAGASSSTTALSTQSGR